MSTLEKPLSFCVYSRLDVTNSSKEVAEKLYEEELVSTCETKEEARILVKQIGEANCDEGDDSSMYFLSQDGLSCVLRWVDTDGSIRYYIVTCKEEYHEPKPIEEIVDDDL